MPAQTIFPNLSALAFYDPLSQCVVFNNYSRSHFEAVFSHPYEINTVETAKTIIHEMCHYVDHISTLSGQRLLVDIVDALNATSANEYEFWRIMKLYKKINALKYEQYYKTLFIPALTDPDHRHWSFSSSFGCKFDSEGRIDPNKQIVFNTFFYHGERIGRIPFSIEALWEANAVWGEIDYHFRAATRLSDAEKTIELNRLDRGLKTWIYNSDLLTYSTAAHLVSKLLNLGDVYRSFKAAKAISTISLNLPFKYYKTIKTPKTALSEDRVETFMNANDPSLVFFYMVLNIANAKESIFSNEDLSIDANKILELNGLPDKATLEAEIENEMYRLGDGILDGPFTSEYARMRAMGAALFKVLGIDGGVNHDPLSYIRLGNTAPLIFQNDLEENEITDKYYAVKEISKFFARFVEACG